VQDVEVECRHSKEGHNGYGWVHKIDVEVRKVLS
jgi:hypothetical protein